MISRKLFTLCLVTFVLLSSITYATPIELPETIGDWSLERSQVEVTPLNATIGDLGQWTQCVYRCAGHALEVILMEGSGPGALRVPERERAHRRYQDRGDLGDGLFDGDTEYKTLTIEGCRAILERHTLLPAALAIAVSQDMTLTIEGYDQESGSDEGVLVNFAREFLRANK